MIKNIYSDTNNIIADNAGKQNSLISIQNAILVAEQLVDEQIKIGNNALAYALRWQLTYLKTAEKFLTSNFTNREE